MPTPRQMAPAADALSTVLMNEKSCVRFGFGFGFGFEGAASALLGASASASPTWGDGLRVRDPAQRARVAP
jgi:hypothetical protein